MSNKNLNEIIQASIERNNDNMIVLARENEQTYINHRYIIKKVSAAVDAFDIIKERSPIVSNMILDSIDEYAKNTVNFNDIIENLDDLNSTKDTVVMSTNSARDGSRDNLEILAKAKISIQETIVEASSLSSDIINLEGAVESLSNGAQEFISFIEQVTALTKSVANIAEHTGLLSLNAAIEAARAGDSGRGFAVVAEQVKILASLTVNLTEEIDGITEKMGSVSQQVGDSVNGCILQLVDSVEKMAQIMDKLHIYIDRIEDVAEKTKNKDILLRSKIVPKVESLDALVDEVFARVNQFQIQDLIDTVTNANTNVSNLTSTGDSSDKVDSDGIVIENDDLQYID